MILELEQGSENFGVGIRNQVVGVGVDDLLSEIGKAVFACSQGF